jgi:uncharacterized protein (TIGR03435 family)
MIFPILLAFLAQSPQSPSFQNASIEPSKSAERSSEWTSRDGVLELRNVTLKTAIAAAYGVEERDVYRPPRAFYEWIDNDRFDIVVKAGKVVPHAELAKMLKSLLAEKFKLETHAEDRELDGFALVTAGEGLKLKPVPPGDGPHTSATNGRLTAERAPLSRIANTLGRLLDVPVVDATGKSGAYNLTLEWGKDDAALDPALERAAGLRLERRKLPVSSVVIDKAERVRALD